jgi:FtsJ-like methyltransferase
VLVIPTLRCTVLPAQITSHPSVLFEDSQMNLHLQVMHRRLVVFKLFLEVCDSPPRILIFRSPTMTSERKRKCAAGDALHHTSDDTSKKRALQGQSESCSQLQVPALQEAASEASAGSEAIAQLRSIADGSSSSSSSFPALWITADARMSALPGVQVDQHGIAWLVHAATHKNEMVAELPKLLLESDEVHSTPTANLQLADQELHAELCAVKSAFDDIPARAFRCIRSACNPAEGLERGLFINRSAMKLANLDHLLHLSSLADSSTAGSTTPSNNALLWADLCGGPGGFTEYLCWRRYSEQQQQQSTEQSAAADTSAHLSSGTSSSSSSSSSTERDCGWGMTLHESVDDSVAEEGCDWHLQHLSEYGAAVYYDDGRTPPQAAMAAAMSASKTTAAAAATVAVTPPLAVAAAATADAATDVTTAAGNSDDSGKQSSTGVHFDSTAAAAAPTSAARAVFTVTYGADGTGDITQEQNAQRLAELAHSYSTAGVHLAVADGGSASARDCYDQEHALQLLVLCECCTALSVLRAGGALVCKLFGTDSPLSASLVSVNLCHL